MLLSVGMIILISLALSFAFQKIKIPHNIAFLLVGIVFGPYVFNMIDQRLLDISPELRKIALIVILIRAGLAIKISDIKKIGRPAILLTFIPATIEIAAIYFIAPLLFDISGLEALLLGAVVAAVSPAIVIPRMIKLIDSGYGHKKQVPQLILAGASLDDVFVLIIFAALIGVYQQQTAFNLGVILNIPLAFLIGGAVGVSLGYLSVLFFKKYHIRDTNKVFIIFGIAFLCVAIEEMTQHILPFSGLVAVISYATTILATYQILANRLVKKFEKIWIGAEMMLFILIGAVLPINEAITFGPMAILLVLSALFFRMAATTIPLIKTQLNVKERLFVVGSYIPKATVQAAIGAIPLSLGIPSGELILTVAVLSILITAPLGALFIDHSYDKLLTKSDVEMT
jgi:solute carrier family 9B (sodium/hydrogen exchanger), member 1/2